MRIYEPFLCRTPQKNESVEPRRLGSLCLRFPPSLRSYGRAGAPALPPSGTPAGRLPPYGSSTPCGSFVSLRSQNSTQGLAERGPTRSSPRRFSYLICFARGIFFEWNGRRGGGRVYSVTLYYNIVIYYNNRYTFYTMKSESAKLGRNLKRIRLSKAISQGDIARTLGVSRGYISNVENGKTNPTLSTITKLARAIGVSGGDLMK